MTPDDDLAWGTNTGADVRYMEWSERSSVFRIAQEDALDAALTSPETPPTFPLTDYKFALP